MDKEDVVYAHAHARTRTHTHACAHTHTHKGILLSHKKDGIMPFAATWMGLGIITLSQSERERQIPYDITHKWNLKYDTSEHIYKTETDSQIPRIDL